MGRPPLPEDEKPIIIPLKLRLYRGRHDRLIEFFDRVPDRLRSASVIHIMSGGSLDALNVSDLPSDDDIESAFDAMLG